MHDDDWWQAWADDSVEHAEAFIADVADTLRQVRDGALARRRNAVDSIPV